MEIGGLEKELLEVIEDTLEEILPEAFAVVKEACRRLVGTEVDGHGPDRSSGTWSPTTSSSSAASRCTAGKVAEMATGEGKTLVATMPLYLNALAGRGAHLVTVNSYLAQRDAEWMGAIYSFLGPDRRT